MNDYILEKYTERIESVLHPTEVLEDFVKMCEIIIDRRKNFFNISKITEEDVEIAILALCGHPAPGKPPEYKKKVRKIRTEYAGIAKSSNKQQKFKKIFPTEIIFGGSYPDLLKKYKAFSTIEEKIHIDVTTKIHIDVLTLDSVQCAACGYMMESIAALPSDVQDMIEYTEWSIKNKDGVGKFLELKGKVLPTICIEKDLVFESIIPQYEELIDEMAKRAPTDEMRERLVSLRGHGFEFDKIQENLAKAGAGSYTRRDYKIE